MRVRAAAMTTAVSVVATWAAEHSLKINADSRGAALFCIASHRQSDEDTADHRLGDGNQRVKSHPVRLLGNAIGRHLNFGLHVTVAAMWTVPRRHQLRLDAEAGASQHTTAARQSHRVRPTRSKERCFCPPGRQSSTAAEDTLASCTHTARTPHTSPIY
ncbi:hypothetical protein TcBrA4_0099090 [Trypanosoma cruzi]|nr:hypothetical protein TcBrA4_0099090 [Trypanosoma cruzi]